MTQTTSLPSPPAEKMEEPQYHSEKESYGKPSLSQPSHLTQSSSPSPKHHCTHHTSTPTPLLDANLSSPAAQDAVHTLTTSLHDATDGQHCTRCTANDAARTLTQYLFTMRQAKKAGNWSKEDKKALKVELKGLMREVKDVVKEEKGKLKAEKGAK